MKSIDDATPEEWNALRKKPNDHPLYGENIPDNSIKFDTVKRPQHYNFGNIECIDAIESMLEPDEFIGYLRGNALKYRWRFRYKGKPIEDLRKARWYEDKLTDYLLGNQDVLG